MLRTELVFSAVLRQWLLSLILLLKSFLFFIRLNSLLSVTLERGSDQFRAGLHFRRESLVLRIVH